MVYSLGAEGLGRGADGGEQRAKSKGRRPWNLELVLDTWVLELGSFFNFD